MPDSSGRFRGAAYPNVPWETEADRRRALINQRRAELIMDRTIREHDDPQPEHLRDLRARHPQSGVPAPVAPAVRSVATGTAQPAQGDDAERL